MNTRPTPRKKSRLATTCWRVLSLPAEADLLAPGPIRVIPLTPMTDFRNENGWTDNPPALVRLGVVDVDTERGRVLLRSVNLDVNYFKEVPTTDLFDPTRFVVVRVAD